MNESNYIIFNNKIIFNNDFNEPLNNYIELIAKYNYLIFSNYKDINISIKNKNKFKVEDSINYVNNNFTNFNQPILYLPDSIKYIYLSYNFI